MLLAAVLPFPAQAQELTGAAGVTRGSDAVDRTFGLSASYTQYLRGPLAASFSYLNEGHLPGHHRDGFAPQLWLHSGGVASRFSLAIGAGPYRYFDTVPADSGAGHADRHGWGTVYSFAATWRSASTPWLYQMRVNRVVLKDGMDTSTLLAGIGYRLDPDDEPASASADAPGAGPRNELMLLGGRSIVNSYESERAWAKGLEYRRAFGPLLHGSVVVLDEGDAQLTRRRGVAAQAWLEPTFYDQKLTLGLGFGPYLASDEHRAKRLVLAGLASLTVSYRLDEAWVGRVTFSRVVSRYDRDSDLILLGLGYRF